MFTTTRASENQSLSILVYGQAGIGKTTLASTIKESEKVCILSLENGNRSISDFAIDVYDITVDANGNELDRPIRHDKFLHALKLFKNEDMKVKYKYLFIDSLTEISQNLIEKLKLAHPDKKDAMKLWGDYNDAMLNIVKSIRDLRPYTVVVLALEKIDVDEFQRRFYGVDVAGKIANRLPAFFDEVFYYSVFDIDGKKERLLFTATSDNLIAKDRSGKLERFEKPDISLILEKINKTKQKEQLCLLPQ